MTVIGRRGVARGDMVPGLCRSTAGIAMAGSVPPVDGTRPTRCGRSPATTADALDVPGGLVAGMAAGTRTLGLPSRGPLGHGDAPGVVCSPKTCGPTPGDPLPLGPAIRGLLTAVAATDVGRGEDGCVPARPIGGRVGTIGFSRCIGMPSGFSCVTCPHSPSRSAVGWTLGTGKDGTLPVTVVVVDNKGKCGEGRVMIPGPAPKAGVIDEDNDDESGPNSTEARLDDVTIAAAVEARLDDVTIACAANDPVSCSGADKTVGTGGTRPPCAAALDIGSTTPRRGTAWAPSIGGIVVVAKAAAAGCIGEVTTWALAARCIKVARAPRDRSWRQDRCGCISRVWRTVATSRTTYGDTRAEISAHDLL